MSYLPNDKQISVSIFPNLEKIYILMMFQERVMTKCRAKYILKKPQRHGQVMILCGSDLKGKTVYPKNNETKPASRLLCKVNKCQITTEIDMFGRKMLLFMHVISCRLCCDAGKGNEYIVKRALLPLVPLLTDSLTWVKLFRPLPWRYVTPH